jgi:hypothetical protein
MYVGGYGFIFLAKLQLTKQHQYKTGCQHSTLSHRLSIRVPTPSSKVGASAVLKFFLYYVILYYIILFYIILYYIILYYIILYHIISYTMH